MNPGVMAYQAFRFLTLYRNAVLAWALWKLAGWELMRVVAAGYAMLALNWRALVAAG